MPYCASCGAHFRPEHPQTDVCDTCWDHEFEADEVLITTNPENRIQTREHRIEDAIAAGVDPLEAPGYVDREETAARTKAVPVEANPSAHPHIDRIEADRHESKADYDAVGVPSLVSIRAYLMRFDERLASVGPIPYPDFGKKWNCEVGQYLGQLGFIRLVSGAFELSTEGMELFDELIALGPIGGDQADQPAESLAARLIRRGLMSGYQNTIHLPTPVYNGAEEHRFEVRYPHSRAFTFPFEFDEDNDRVLLRHPALANEPAVQAWAKEAGVELVWEEVDEFGRRNADWTEWAHAVDSANDLHWQSLLFTAEFTTPKCVAGAVALHLGYKGEGGITPANARNLLAAFGVEDPGMEAGIEALRVYMRIDPKTKDDKGKPLKTPDYFVNFHIPEEVDPDNALEAWAMIHGYEQGYLTHKGRYKFPTQKLLALKAAHPVEEDEDDIDDDLVPEMPEPIEVNYHPLTPGHFCSVSFPAKGDREAYCTHGIVLALEGDQVRVRLNSDRSALGKLYPAERVKSSHFDAMPFEKAPNKNKAHAAKFMAEYQAAQARAEVPAAPAPSLFPDLWIEPNGQLSLVPGPKTKPVQLDLFA